MLLLVCAVYSRDTGRPAVWEPSLWSQIHVLTIQLQYINPFISYYRYVFLYVPTLSQTPGILSLIQSDPKVTLFANSFCNIFFSYTFLPGDLSHRTFYILSHFVLFIHMPISITRIASKHTLIHFYFESTPFNTFSLHILIYHIHSYSLLLQYSLRPHPSFHIYSLFSHFLSSFFDIHSFKFLAYISRRNSF